MLRLFDYADIFVNLLKLKVLRRFTAAPAPRVLAYTVTWRCNCACDMCGIKNVDGALKNRKMELNAGDISRIFSDPLLRNLDLIRFTGGEPFLKEDFTDIVEAIIEKTKTKIYYITTNGFFSRRIFAFLERLAPKTANLAIQVSLDAIGKAHDDIRKLPGLYDKVMETLAGLSRLRKKHNFTFGVNQTVTPGTLGFIEGISGVCRKFKCDHKIYVAYEAHESDILEGGRLEREPCLMSKPERSVITNLYSRIEEHYRKKGEKKGALFSPVNLWDAVERYILLGSKNRLLEGRAFPNPACLAMFFYLRLLPDGRVMPCTLKPKTIGNLKNQTFGKVWNSSLARDMRSEVKKCPGCWVECDIVPNVVYSFDIVKEMCKRLCRSNLFRIGR